MFEPPAKPFANEPASMPGRGKTPVCSSLHACCSPRSALAASDLSSGSTALLHCGRSMLHRAQVGAENMAAWPLLNGTHGSFESLSAGAFVAVLNSSWTCSRPLMESGSDRAPFQASPSLTAKSPPLV